MEIYTRQEEYEIFEIIRKGEEAKRRLSTETNNKAELLDTIRKGNLARNEFFIRNIRLCGAIVDRKYKTYIILHPDLRDDLISESYFGLDRAINLFDHNMGIKFSTYASRWIIHFVGRYIRRTFHPIIHSENMSVTYIRLENYINKYKIENNGEIPDEDTLFKLAKTSKSKFDSIMSLMKNTVELDAPLKKNDCDRIYGDVVPDSRCVVDTVETNEITEIIRDAVNNCLTSDEKFLIKNLYGFEEDKPMSRKDICSLLDLSKEEYNSIKSSSLYKLKKILTEKNIGTTLSHKKRRASFSYGMPTVRGFS